MRWLNALKRSLSSDNDGELGRADLVALVAQGILSLGRRGTRGEWVFPEAVIVRVHAASGSLEVLRAWANDPVTEAEITARLLNERVEARDAPFRRWEIEIGDAEGVDVVGDPSAIFAVLVVEGGDRDGDRFPLGAGRREWRLGRGRWHTDQRVQNDVMLSETATWLSRAAAILRRSGSGFEIEARDQGDYIVVMPREGAPRRPAMTASGRVSLALGDRVEFNDGGQACVALRLEAS